MHTAMAVPSPPTKDALRAEALRVRRAFSHLLSATDREILERALKARIAPHVGRAAVIAGYHPLRDEIDPTRLLDALAAEGRTIALPWFADRDAAMIFRAGPATQIGPWGVAQPEALASEVRPDLVLAPMVAADRAGNRLGHGRGHYDRALAELRRGAGVRTIGLGWDVQLLGGVIPADAWDVPMDAVATPGCWIERKPE